jgi:Predicted oxidoreductases (related to aryl-alcohol dehydrogenases)
MSLERIVLGTAGIGGIWGKVREDDSIQTVLEALAAGVPAIDTAPAYANAELYVGKALRAWKGKMPVISAKAGRLQGFTPDNGKYDYSRTGMLRSISATLTRLGISELDVLFLHDPANIPEHDFGAAMEVMHELKRASLARAVGLGGNPPLWAWNWIERGDVDALMEYNRLNACNCVAIHTSLKACLEQKVTYYAASPLHMGLLGRSYQTFTDNTPAWLGPADMARARRLQAIANGFGIPLRALAHRFLLNLQFSFKIVIGPSNPKELLETLGDFAAGPLPQAVFEQILQPGKDTIVP